MTRSKGAKSLPHQLPNLQLRGETSSDEDDDGESMWSDSVAQFTKCSFNPTVPVRVIFHGEEAVDGGGPCRE